LGACALTAGMVRRRVGNRYLSLILFAFLAFNPVSWNASLARVLRQGLYMSLSLALIALAVKVAFPSPSESNRSIWRVTLRGLGLGLVSACYWMTREEGLWLVPAVVVVLALAVVEILWSQWSPTSENGKFSL